MGSLEAQILIYMTDNATTREERNKKK